MWGRQKCGDGQGKRQDIHVGVHVADWVDVDVDDLGVVRHAGLPLLTGGGVEGRGVRHTIKRSAGGRG